MEDLRFAVEEWTCDNSRPLEVIAQGRRSRGRNVGLLVSGQRHDRRRGSCFVTRAGVGAAGPNPVFPVSFSIETIIADERDLLPRMRALSWSAMSWQHGAGRRDVLGSRAREAEPACKTSRK